METNDAAQQAEAVKKIYAFVLDQMKAGKEKSEIVDNLVEMQIESGQARDFVENIHAKVAEQREREKPDNNTVLLAILGGLAAAICGGIIWGIVAITSNREIGILAWGIGLLTGYAVVFITGGKKGKNLQIIAAGASIFGIIVGKYVAFSHYLKLSLIVEYGTDVAESISILSTTSVKMFFYSITEIASPYDLLWVGLALITAWKIPRGLGINLHP